MTDSTTDRVEQLLDDFARVTAAGPSRPWQAPRTQARARGAPLPLAVGTAIVLAAIVLARSPATGPSQGGATPGSLSQAPATAATVAPQAGPGIANCPLTRPDPPFAAPSANAAPASPPGDRAWYGTARLWTMLELGGEVWEGLPHDLKGFGQKVFWWSADWPGLAEPQPALTVTGERLDAPGAFTIPPPATNAGEPSIGEAMLQGVEVPAAGCWRITGTYRGTSLPFVAWVGDAVAGAPDASMELSSGLPVSIDGQPVAVGAAAQRAETSSTDDTPFLVGGWLMNPGEISCPVVLLGEASWSGCLGARLLSRPVMGTASLVVVPGAGSVALPRVAPGLVEPIVLRVHTHDPACPSSPRFECGTLPVLDAIVWEGAIQPMPTPASTRPPTGLTEAQAEAAALQYAAAHSIVRPSLVSAAAGPVSLVADGGSPVPADQWVWAVVVRGSGGMTQLVVFDYVTGSFLSSETPAP
jgi:hypothetical protein